LIASPSEYTVDVFQTVFLFVFNSFFAVGWLGMTWLYPAGKLFPHRFLPMPD